MSCENIKRENAYLNDQLADIREREERRLEDERRASKERRRQQQRDYRESLCHASDWPEAFSKGLMRIEAEASTENPVDDPDMWFTRWRDEVKYAQAIYTELMAAAQAEIDAIHQRVLSQTADKVEARFGLIDGTAQALRNNDPEFLTNW